MIPDGTKPADVTKEQAQGVIDAVNAYREQSGISLNNIGRAFGMGGSTISQVLSWKYQGDWQSVIIDLDRWLEDQLKADAIRNEPTFIWTKVAEEIKAIADIAIQLRTIGLIYGPTTSGLGKTMALEAIRAEKRGSILITIEKFQPSSTGILMAIAHELRISAGNSCPHLYNTIKKELKGTPRLLMVDQIHNLCGTKDDKPFYILSDLFDATKAPQLWCGTTDIVAYLDRGTRGGKETLAQIRRRIGVSRDLLQRTRENFDGGPGEPLFTIAEIRRIFGKGKMRLAPDAERHLCQLANLPDSGALGLAVNLWKMATHYYSGKQNVLTASMLRGVHNLLAGQVAFQALENQIQEESRIAKAG